ncbi:MAG: xylose isomerase [Acidobacteria bacterium]|nr:MAG: xylose isomerase [Acidobacteriota bacterium]PYU46240.1 MAG: xylose isomerase [Acidobacteriota bacterium]PYU73737.1 MAG: xylose isomerase [Acidobacteriota bacterium]
MNKQNRRAFLQVSTVALASGLGPVAALRGGVTADDLVSNLSVAQVAPTVPANEGKQPLRLGLILGIGRDPHDAIAKVHDLGFPTCQAFLEEIDPVLAGRLREALNKYQIEVTSLVVGGPGREVWDFYGGPLTIGLVPRETREARIAHIKKASDFAKQCGIAAVQTHCGFIPENPNDPVYKETVTAMRDVAGYCKRNGQNFRYETGQETPIALVRAIQDVGLDNQGVNFDLANLILYGKANPVDAIELLGPYVQGIHAKDGLWPTNPKELGQEVPIGKGKVDFPRIIGRLKELNYRGAVTIEREISGPQQVEDVRAAKAYLEKLIG